MSKTQTMIILLNVMFANVGALHIRAASGKIGVDHQHVKTDQLQNTFRGHPDQEIWSGARNVQHGDHDVVEGLSSLRATMQSEMGKMKEKYKLKEEIYNLLAGNKTSIPIGKIHSLVAADANQGLASAQAELGSLSKIEAGSAKSSVGLMEMEDAKSQELVNLSKTEDIVENKCDQVETAGPGGVEKIKIQTYSWAYENHYLIYEKTATGGTGTLLCKGGEAQGGTRYTDSREYEEDCCLPAGDYKLKCMCTYGDGWHGGFMEIGDVNYCTSFVSGHTQWEDFTLGPTPAPTPPPPCYSDVTTVKMRTTSWAYENGYQIFKPTGTGGYEATPVCKGGASQGGTSYADHQIYEEECCLPGLPEGQKYKLKCICTYGDAWHGGYMEINGEKHCLEGGWGSDLETHFHIEEDEFWIAAAAAGAGGDPHATNMDGTKFNIMSTGHFSFLTISQLDNSSDLLKQPQQHYDLAMDAWIDHVEKKAQKKCTATFIQNISLSGSWVGIGADSKVSFRVVHWSPIEESLQVRIDQKWYLAREAHNHLSKALIKGTDSQLAIDVHGIEVHVSIGKNSRKIDSYKGYNFLNVNLKGLLGFNNPGYKVGGLLGHSSSEALKALSQPPAECASFNKFEGGEEMTFLSMLSVE